MTGRIVVVGDVVTDVVAAYADPLAVGGDTSARIELTGGGSAANIAAWLASTGVPVTLVAMGGAGGRAVRAAGRARAWADHERRRGLGAGPAADRRGGVPGLGTGGARAAGQRRGGGRAARRAHRARAPRGDHPGRAGRGLDRPPHRGTRRAGRGRGRDRGR